MFPFCWVGPGSFHQCIPTTRNRSPSVIPKATGWLIAYWNPSYSPCTIPTSYIPDNLVEHHHFWRLFVKLKSLSTIIFGVFFCSCSLHVSYFSSPKSVSSAVGFSHVFPYGFTPGRAPTDPRVTPGRAWCTVRRNSTRGVSRSPTSARSGHPMAKRKGTGASMAHRKFLDLPSYKMVMFHS